MRADVLDAGQRELLDSILLRLVRLGDTGGATRRVASRGEFDDARWSLIQKLASEEGKRLLLLRGSTDQPTVEIAHEALVTAWPYFQNLLQEAADDKRVLDTLIPRAPAWAGQQDQGERAKRLAVGADLELFAGLLDRHAAWLAPCERDHLQASRIADRRRRRIGHLLVAALGILTIVAGIAGGVAWWLKGEADAQAERAAEQAELAEKRRLEPKEQTQIAERERTLAERRAVEAETALVWSLLEFANGGISANNARGLWQIATTTPTGKRQSHEYLREDGHIAEVYARRPLEVIRALSLGPENDVTETLVDLLASRKAAVREQTVWGLRALGATDQALAIAELLADLNYEVRAAATRALGALGATDQVAAITELLDDDHASVRLAAIGALGMLGVVDQGNAIAGRLADDDPNVRLAAVSVLQSLGATDQAAAIAELLADDDYDLREAVVQAVGALGAPHRKAIIPVIVKHLADGHDDVRWAAVEALATLNATDQAAAVAARLADEDWGVREAALAALGNLGAIDEVVAIAARLA